MTAPAPEPSDPPALRVVCWGVRGSIPSPGPDTVRYGGNTSCVEVRGPDGRRIVFDAGTGFRALSRALEAEGGPVDADLFVTHYHWDHIQGFPFCMPLYDAGTRLRVYGPPQGEVGIGRVFAGQMERFYFPVPLDRVPARLEFAHVDGAPWRSGGVEVAALAVSHPGNTLGYRVRAGGASLAYLPDNDLGREDDDGGAGYEQVVEWVRGVDLLLHDAMFTEDEYRRHPGWGHSTFRQAVRLAEDAGVRRLLLFHHAPDRTDAELDEVVRALRAELAARGSPLELAAAVEGAEIVVAGRAA